MSDKLTEMEFTPDQTAIDKKLEPINKQLIAHTLCEGGNWRAGAPGAPDPRDTAFAVFAVLFADGTIHDPIAG